MYQPRMIVSISNAQDVARSAGHWKRKLRTRKGANVEARGSKLKPPWRRGRPRTAGNQPAVFSSFLFSRRDDSAGRDRRVNPVRACSTDCFWDGSAARHQAEVLEKIDLTG
jgi:hypothetical protein